jgi:hypothetical protein
VRRFSAILLFILLCAILASIHPSQTMPAQGAGGAVTRTPNRTLLGTITPGPDPVPRQTLPPSSAKPTGVLFVAIVAGLIFMGWLFLRRRK